MIKSISMRNCASYDETGIELQDCQKVNFIYGANGSGKSTISGFLQNPHDSKYHDSSIIWEKGETSDIRVYNRRFRDGNLQKDAIDGIFTIGEDTIRDREKVRELKEQREQKEKGRDKCKESLEKICKQKENLITSFRDTVWNVILKHNEHIFKSAFSGLRNNKEKFRDEVIRRYRINHHSSYTQEQLEERAQTLFTEQRPVKCPVLELPDADSIRVITEIESNEIWGKVIVGNADVPISELIQSLGNQDWVRQGRAYIGNDGICPFCQKQTIDSDFNKHLSEFFDGEYQKDISRVEHLIHIYDTETEKVLSSLEQCLQNEQGLSLGSIDASVYRAQLQGLRERTKANLSAMGNKKDEPSRKKTIDSTSEMIGEFVSAIRTANHSIEQKNRIVDDYAHERDVLIDDVWTFLLDQHEYLISSYAKDLQQNQKAQKGIRGSIERYQEEINDLKQQIIDVEKNITSVQPTIDSINRVLKGFGFCNFKIVPCESNTNQYQIQRPDGTLVKDTLSEGEETFITFLYFMQLTEGATHAEAVSNERILVLDDPISSLDSTVLYIVSSMVKNLIKKIRDGESSVKQLFVLTHNTFFHKEASFIDGRCEGCNDVHYWIIHKENGVSYARSYGINNPINTSYALLWREIKENSHISVVSLQNTMRRILENYFGMLGKRRDSYIIGSFSTLEEQMLCRSLLYWINDGSHSIPDDIQIDNAFESVENYKKIFKEIFYNTGNADHYDMMMGVVEETVSK